MIEIWKDVIGYDGKYQISNYGNVKSKKGNILKKHINNWGYYAISFLYKKQRKTYVIHRLVGKHFIQNPKNKPYINHIDGNKLNNNINNLEWVTQKENCQHAADTGLTIKGRIKKSESMKNAKSEKCPRAILTTKEVIDIRTLYKTNLYTQLELAKKYGVERSTIGKIVTNKNWNKL